MSEEQKVMECDHLRAILHRISFRPSCVDMGWRWQIEEISDGLRLLGWFVQASFKRPDTYTGVIGTGYGRKEFIAFGVDKTTVIKTAWVCIELTIMHELREAFCFDSLRVFNPHKTIDQLLAGETP